MFGLAKIPQNTRAAASVKLVVVTTQLFILVAGVLIIYKMFRAGLGKIIPISLVMRSRVASLQAPASAVSKTTAHPLRFISSSSSSSSPTQPIKTEEERRKEAEALARRIVFSDDFANRQQINKKQIRMSIEEWQRHEADTGLLLSSSCEILTFRIP